MGLRRAIFGPNESEKEEIRQNKFNRMDSEEGCNWCGGRIGKFYYNCSYRGCETLFFCSDRCLYEHEAARHGTA
jgi:hypothetical protein